MENQKDTTEGQAKQQSKLQPTQGYAYVVRKAEKLTTALYLVTDILSEREPLKWKARESGVEVLSDISVVATVSVSEKQSILRGVIKKIERVVSFLDIASSSRMMTEMNASVLKHEYLALKDSVEAEWSRTQERSKVLLNEHFFDVPKDDIQGYPLALKEVPLDIERTPASQSSNIEISKPSPEQTLPPRVTHIENVPKPSITPPNSIRPQQSFVGPARPILIDRQIVERPRLDDSRDDRRKIILALLKQKPAVNVGDIAKSIPGVSEKTIQRELLAMVAEGTLVKRGERRWSVYSLRAEV